MNSNNTKAVRYEIDHPIQKVTHIDKQIEGNYQFEAFQLKIYVSYYQLNSILSHMKIFYLRFAP